MAELPSTVLEIGVPAAAGLLYALIWYATRGLPGSAKVLARILPLLVIVPTVLYLSLGMPTQRVGSGSESAAKPPTAVRDGSKGAPQGEIQVKQQEPAPTAAPPPTSRPDASPPLPQPSPARAPKMGSKDITEESAKGGPAPGVPAAPQADWDVVPVFYGTDRVRKDEPKRIAYSADRARRLELGRALVTVPKAGHWVHRDAPELVTNTMVRWLTREGAK